MPNLDLCMAGGSVPSTPYGRRGHDGAGDQGGLDPPEETWEGDVGAVSSSAFDSPVVFAGTSGLPSLRGCDVVSVDGRGGGGGAIAAKVVGDVAVDGALIPARISEADGAVWDSGSVDEAGKGVISALHRRAQTLSNRPMIGQVGGGGEEEEVQWGGMAERRERERGEQMLEYMRTGLKDAAMRDLFERERCRSSGGRDLHDKSPKIGIPGRTNEERGRGQQESVGRGSGARPRSQQQLSRRESNMFSDDCWSRVAFLRDLCCERLICSVVVCVAWRSL